MNQNNSAFPTTSKFKASVDLINRVDDSKFSLILKRIIKNLHHKKVEPFNTDEKAQLETVLGFSSSELGLVLDASSFIFQQAAYFGLQPQKFHSQLQQASVSDEKAEAFKTVWELEGGNYLANLKESTVCPKVLSNVKYHLHLQMAQSNLSKCKDPTAIFELTLDHTDPELTESRPERLMVEFNHEQLFQFYNNLERIQRQLDSLS